ncbi:MAG: methyltransferase domain-containing protein [Chloroflexota bacterium]
MDWHNRYLQQAGWTIGVRNYLLKKAGLDDNSKILDLGCGTGALLSEFPIQKSVHGIDINFENLLQSQKNASKTHLVCGDGQNLPYLNAAFDISYCHFVLLWAKQPEFLLSEMCRVTKPGGYVIAFAEPDYGGRIDFPVELETSAKLQIEALRKQGADPGLGRKLPKLFVNSGLKNIEYGVIGGEWDLNSCRSDDFIESSVLREDLSGSVPIDEIEKFLRLEKESREIGARVLFVPTFFAFGEAV